MPDKKAEITFRQVADLIPYVKNPRTHSEDQVAVIAGSIREFGWTNPVLIDGRNGIIAGHGRVLAARKLGLVEVPCIELSHLSEAQRRAYVIADNQTALRAGWDDELLRLELGELQALEFNLDLLGFETDALDALLAPVGATGLTDPDDVPGPPKTPVATRGDLWALGRHRLLCGDTKDHEVRAVAIGGADVDLVVYDPPFENAEAWNWLVSAPKSLIFADYRHAREAFHAARAFPVVYQFIWDGVTSWYTPNRPLMRHKTCLYAAQKEGWVFEAATYSDDKIRTAHTVHNTRGTSDYVPLPFGHVHLQTVFQAQNTTIQGGHPHAKPVAWVQALMAGAGGRIILDQFAGSGTCFIAAQEDMRVCGIELDAAMCDVAIARWQNFTGLEATLDGKTFREIEDERHQALEYA
jgi:hypothetical protein